MANNIYSLLTAYLQYQRDIGVDGLVFDHRSAVKKILSSGRAGQPVKRVGGTPVKAGPGGYPRGAPEMPALRTAPKATGGGGDTPPHHSQPKARTAGTLDIQTLIKRARKAPAPPSGRRERLAEIYREVAGCDKCGASRGRAKVVFGSGSADARLLVLGDAPEPPEDAAGLPLLGEAGKLFDRILDKMGLDRKNDVFTAYAQKCLDPGGFNREYAEACRPVVDRQIDIIEPKAILVFGEAAANFLLGNDAAIEQLRAINHNYRERPVVVTYDLPLMLKEKQYRFDAWEDMKKIISILSR